MVDAAIALEAEGSQIRAEYAVWTVEADLDFRE
jgi:hypothetical protein